MKKTKAAEMSIVLGMIIAIVLSIGDFSKKCDSIRQKTLRMHVIANSDSKEDQELKLKVRDAVLSAGEKYFDGTLNADEAEKILILKKDELLKAAEKAVNDNGYDYEVKINIGKANFPTRTYDDEITLPAGEYEAVNVIIGEGKGHNWWCVMFPPMCLPAAENDKKMEDVLNEDELKIVKSDVKLEPRFKIIEIFEEIKKKI